MRAGHISSGLAVALALLALPLLPHTPARAPRPAHWAYRPLVRPAVPADSSGQNPIDRFLHAKLSAAGLVAAPAADRRTLLRRLGFDLVGLPPTPEEIQAFARDARPDAYQRQVERLLGSPAYGERWARHWMDVVHFAETHGHDQDVPRENAWPYRDYLVRAFNDDRPLGRFIEEQVAGDVLYPESPDAIPALGMLSAGPWDESSQQSIRDDTIDKKHAQNLDRDDMVTTVLTAFSSTTIHCARCHDHKFDPISLREYYGLQAVFAGVDRANRTYDQDPATHRKRRELLARQEQIRSANEAWLLDPAHDLLVAHWEKSQGSTSWQSAEVEEVTCRDGSVPTRLPDRSVRFGGPRPERDVYTLVIKSPLARITAVRLELLTDESLPHRGPGRQDNGNLHLNELRIESAVGERFVAAPVRSARADFDQAGWTVSHAIDRNPGTAWGIYPRIGQNHEAVFLLERPVETARLRLALEQTHGQGHLIGRLRLSVTGTDRPEHSVPLPVDLAALLEIESPRRSPAQRATLARHVLLAEVDRALAALPAPRQVFVATNDFKPEGSFRPARVPRPVEVLRRGDMRNPQGLAVPAGLSLMPGFPGKLDLTRPEEEGQRRAGLARWLADPRNVLTWRSMANRVWHLHFGKGIVDTPGDLGTMGGTPSHPELLDWLACELRDSGGSLKHLHRLILNSDAYQRSSRHDPTAARVDASNRLLWRMNRSRLDAEGVRDAVLAVSGELDRTMGGPSVKHFRTSKGLHVTPNVDYETHDPDAPGSQRRSVYRFLFRTLPDPFFDALDCPDASQFTAARASSVTPLQALTLLNDRFMVRQASHFARRVKQEAGEDRSAQVRRMIELALGREAQPREIAALAEYARKHTLEGACRLVFNLNEFLFVD